MTPVGTSSASRSAAGSGPSDLALLPVSEVFGPVWQGEGPHTGLRCSFLRLGLCNLTCEWCDTPYTWDRSRYDLKVECPPRDWRWITERLAAQGTRHLILSGGEPLIHARNTTLRHVLNLWTNVGRTVDVETNGTLPPPPWASMVSLFAVSPKIITRDPAHRRLRPEALAAWAAQPNSIVKFVCRQTWDVDAAAALVEQYGWPRDRVWIMPEGRTSAEVLAHAKQLEHSVLQHGFQFTLRQHTLLHEDERGH